LSSNGDTGQGSGDDQQQPSAGTVTLPDRLAAPSQQDGTSSTEPGEPDPENARWEREERAVAESISGGPDMIGKVRMLAFMAATVLAGMGLRAHLGQPVAAVAVFAAWLAAAGMLAPAAERLKARQQPGEPGWVADMIAYRTWLPRRVPPVPAETLAAADRYLTGLPARRWQSAHLFIARAPAGQQVSMGITFPRGNRLEVILGDHVATGPVPVATATLAHETRHGSAWRLAARNLAETIRGQGMFLIGWAVPWPAVILVAVLTHIACTLVIWAEEVSCDLGAAADAGPAAMLGVCDVMAASRRIRRTAARAVPAPKRLAAWAVHWAAGPGHPPIPVRRAIIRLRYWRVRPGDPGGLP
jgi:hypothetical protein